MCIKVFRCKGLKIEFKLVFLDFDGYLGLLQCNNKVFIIRDNYKEKENLVRFINNLFNLFDNYEIENKSD